MSRALAGKDIAILKRDRLLRLLMIAVSVLVVASLFTGLQRERVFHKEKAAAIETDRSVWMNQGERNPHSAAHFSRYAFRPASPLALLDPGTSDFAGLAIWMEAHYQDPAVFRRAEDGGELSRYLQLTPAVVVLIVAPLLVFVMLFDSIAGEREDRTLRQLLASGVDTRAFFKGKIRAGLRMTLRAYTALFIPVILLSAFVAPSSITPDAVARAVSLYLMLAAYLVVFVALAIAVSSLFRRRQAAFLALSCLWALMAIVLPRLGADVATSIHPQPDAWESTGRLRAASAAYWDDAALQAEVEQEALERYGVASVDDLPIAFSAYTLQASEHISEPLFDAFYDDLDERYEGQESFLRSVSLLTPTIAASALSRGIAGTDRVHQRHFASAAEMHRREMVQLLNEDFMVNGGSAGYSYTADGALWAQFEDFDYEVPRLSQLAGRYAVDLALLLGWVMASIALAYWGVQRAVVGEERAV